LKHFELDYHNDKKEMVKNMKSIQVIAVDLDGTITLTDTLYEAVLALLVNKPLFIFLLPFWLAKGIAFLKLQVAKNCELDATTLPYNLPLIDWLKEQKSDGKRIVLCTAANERIALAVSEHLKLFDDVIASDAKTNLKSTNKLKALNDRFGNKGFDYVGNSSSDIEVWAGACHAIVVNAKNVVQNKVSQVTSISQSFPSQNLKFSDFCKAIRVHQWLKNLLLFVPLLAAHQIGNIQSLNSLSLAFISFSLCASSVYITNDLLDLENDRRHPRKKYRPFASAKISIGIGVIIIPILVSASFALGMIVGKDFFDVLVLYFILAIAYSMILKRVVIVDCLTLATLYTIRIIAGAAAASLSLSFWLLAFSVFIFLSLALVKRYAELIIQKQDEKRLAHGRGYEVSDSSLLQTFGVSAGYLSILVILLYMRSEDVLSLYVQPEAIWFALPILLFWISWVWLKAARGEMHDDPIIFAIKDKASLLVAVVIAIVFIYAATGMRF